MVSKRFQDEIPLNLPNDNTLYMAGIFNEFNGENKFVILTTTANMSIADVHDRMPVILQKSMVEDWVKSEGFALLCRLFNGQSRNNI